MDDKREYHLVVHPEPDDEPPSKPSKVVNDEMQEIFQEMLEQTLQKATDEHGVAATKLLSDVTGFTPRPPTKH